MLKQMSLSLLMTIVLLDGFGVMRIDEELSPPPDVDPPPPEPAGDQALPASVATVNGAVPASPGIAAPQAQPAGSTTTTTGGDPADGSLDPEVIDRPE
jgi:hypothetical protein